MEGTTMLFCSFCGKAQDEVKKLIAGPTVFICDECIELCSDIVEVELDVQPLERYIERVHKILNLSVVRELTVGELLQEFGDSIDVRSLSLPEFLGNFKKILHRRVSSLVDGKVRELQAAERSLEVELQAAEAEFAQASEHAKKTFAEHQSAAAAVSQAERKLSEARRNVEEVRSAVGDVVALQ